MSCQNNDIQDYDTLIDMVTAAIEKFDQYANKLDIDKKLIASIKQDFNLV